jgi:hypothetical protein
MSDCRLVQYLAEDRDYIIYVGLPTDRPSRWAQVVHYTPAEVVTIDGQRAAVADISSCIVAYAHGSVLYTSEICAPLPPDIDFTHEKKRDYDSVRLSDIEAGSAMVKVNHGPRTRRNDRGSFDHTTTFTSISDEKIRVLRFGVYGKYENEYLMGNVGGAFFSAEDFRNWYGQRGEWILPGESVADLHNYTTPGALWAYYIETESGQRFIAGGIFT